MDLALVDEDANGNVDDLDVSVSTGVVSCGRIVIRVSCGENETGLWKCEELEISKFLELEERWDRWQIPLLWRTEINDVFLITRKIFIKEKRYLYSLRSVCY